MKIEIIGGGPAGLYLAILMKRFDPNHEIRVYERGKPDEYSGWGIVFSGKTLSSLREADRTSHQQISEQFSAWNGVHVVHKGERIEIGGNHFVGLGRAELIKILQKRAQELGVEILFENPIDDPEALRDCDLLVGADGIGSVVRTTYADYFQPTIRHANNRYIWLGTPQLFHGLTMTFRDSKAGLFASHSYKYSKDMSTFIVECNRETWDQADLDSMDIPTTLSYLAEIFADDLDGHPLLSHNSKWLRFLVVKNDNWFHENVVLLGDALRTAHFSIGSGAKLAMEDSIYLSGCFARETDLPKALSAFQAGRKPGVDAYQAIARQSMLWFENVSTIKDLDPIPFAYENMTRAGKIDHQELRKRDENFSRLYEDWRKASMANASKVER
ncbi:MAG: monooxygenase [Planctomycetota bacterium]|jgi:anthraniloyl-CoA monooxygenase|nr:monooxygenase [Planctomycetota bacterium]